MRAARPLLTRVGLSFREWILGQTTALEVSEVIVVAKAAGIEPDASATISELGVAAVFYAGYRAGMQHPRP